MSLAIPPATTVVSATSYSIAPVVGTSIRYARQDHTHGTPAPPTTATDTEILGYMGVFS